MLVCYNHSYVRLNSNLYQVLFKVYIMQVKLTKLDYDDPVRLERASSLSNLCF